MIKCYLNLLVLIGLPFCLLAQMPCTGGMADGYPCDNADLQSFMSLADMGTTRTNDIWGWTDPNTGKEYAVVGLNDGTAFVDISVPTSPVFVGKLPTYSSNSNWRDVKVYNNHAFIVSEASAHGMQVFDLTRLDGATPGTLFMHDAHMDLAGSNGNSHNIVANEETGYMYSVGTNSLANGGLVFVDVSAPKNPVIVGSFSSDGYSHDAICFNYRGPDKDYICKEICIGFNADTYTIVDVTNKSNPIQISRNGYNDHEYTHQGWITDDHRYLITDDELDEYRNGHNTRSLIFDISDLDNPVAVGYYDHAQAAIDHNMYIKGRYVYQSNYRAGVRILDIGDIANANMTPVAHFDVFPSDDNGSFAGSWSNYPYFRSGNVIATHITGGLYVFNPTFAHYTMTLESASVLELCPGETKSFEIDLTAYAGFSENVNLSVTNVDAALVEGAVPSDLSVSLSQTVSAPNNTVTITVTADPSAVDQAYSLLLRGIGNDASSEQTMALGVKVQSGALLSAKVLLQGPYDVSNSIMTDDLRSNGLLPAREPYSALLGMSANLQNQAVLMRPGLQATTGNDAIVDWVLLELRNSSNPTILVARRAALLQRDGDVVEVDGVSPVKFINIPTGDYYVAVRHRNHLGIMTQNTFTF